MDFIPIISLFIVTLISGIISLAYHRNSEHSIRLFLSFSGAFLLSVCVMHLLPELFKNQAIDVAPFILIGFFLQIVFEYASQGVEHGHIHHASAKGTFPFLIYTGLAIHSFTEGLPLSGIRLETMFHSPLYWGILLHKIPVVIVLISLFFAHNVSRTSMIMGIIFFAALAPLGGVFGKVLSGPSLKLLPYFLATSTGIFLHISTVILFETSYNHRFNFIKFVFIIAGGALAILLF